jgi:hypothetical protein
MDREFPKFFDLTRVGGAEPELDFKDRVCRLTHVVATNRKLTHFRTSRTLEATRHTGTSPDMTKT